MCFISWVNKCCITLHKRKFSMFSVLTSISNSNFINTFCSFFYELYVIGVMKISFGIFEIFIKKKVSQFAAKGFLRH